VRVWKWRGIDTESPVISFLKKLVSNEITDMGQIFVNNKAGGNLKNIDLSNTRSTLRDQLL